MWMRRVTGCRLIDWRLDRVSENFMDFLYLWDSITFSAMRIAWSSAVNIEETDEVSD